MDLVERALLITKKIDILFQTRSDIQLPFPQVLRSMYGNHLAGK